MSKKFIASILTIFMIIILATPTIVAAKPNDSPLFVSVRASQPSTNESSEGYFPEIMPFRGIYSILKPQSLSSSEYIHYSAVIRHRANNTTVSNYTLELKAPGESYYYILDQSDNNANPMPKSEIFYRNKFSGDSPPGDYDFRVTLDGIQTTFKIVLSEGYTVAAPTIISGTDSKPVNGMKFSKVKLVTDGFGQRDIAPNEKLASYTYLAVQFEITGTAIESGEFIPTLTSNTAISMWGDQPFKNYDSVKVKKGDTLLNRTLYQDGLGLGMFGVPNGNLSDLKLELIFKPSVPAVVTSSAPVSSSTTNSSSSTTSSQLSSNNKVPATQSDNTVSSSSSTVTSNTSSIDSSSEPVVSAITSSEVSKNSSETSQLSSQTTTTENERKIPTFAIVLCAIILVVLTGVLIAFRNKIFKKK